MSRGSNPGHFIFPQFNCMSSSHPATSPKKEIERDQKIVFLVFFFFVLTFQYRTKKKL